MKIKIMYILNSALYFVILATCWYAFGYCIPVLPSCII